MKKRINYLFNIMQLSRQTIHRIMIIPALILLLTGLRAEKGQALLDSMSARYRALSPCVLGFEIRQYYDRDTADCQTSVGSFYIGGDTRFRVDFIGQEIIYDGQWLWSYDKDNRQVVIEPLDPQSSLKFIFDMLFGNWANFRVVSLKILPGDDEVTLGLKTRDDNDYFNAIFLDIDRASRQLRQATYLDFKQLKTVIRFSPPKTLQPAVRDILFDTGRLETKELIDLRQ